MSRSKLSGDTEGIEYRNVLSSSICPVFALLKTKLESNTFGACGGSKTEQKTPTFL